MQMEKFNVDTTMTSLSVTLSSAAGMVIEVRFEFEFRDPSLYTSTSPVIECRLHSRMWYNLG